MAEVAVQGHLIEVRRCPVREGERDARSGRWGNRRALGDSAVNDKGRSRVRDSRVGFAVATELRAVLGVFLFDPQVIPCHAQRVSFFLTVLLEVA